MENFLKRWNYRLKLNKLILFTVNRLLINLDHTYNKYYDILVYKYYVIYTFMFVVVKRVNFLYNMNIILICYAMMEIQHSLIFV